MTDQALEDQIIQKIILDETVPIEEVKWVCSKSSQIFLSEPTVIDVQSPVTVVGDVHADLDSVLYIFKNFGNPEDNIYVFLGDYIDRGPKSLSTLLILLSYKVKLGPKFLMIRGNHEDVNVSKQYQFRDEVIQTYDDPKLMEDFDTVFTSLPLGVLINNTILCIHGGIGPAVRSVDTIRNIKRPFISTDQDPMYDILWADPQKKNLIDWGNGKRATSCAFAATPILEFFERSNITAMIRAHECVIKGYKYSLGKSINFVTVFSSANYMNQNNKAAVILIDANGEYTFKTFGPLLNESSNVV